MATSTLRGTAAISEYLTLIDGLAIAAETLKSLHRREIVLRDEVLRQIGERRSVMHDGGIRTLKSVEKESYSLVNTEAETVAHCLAAGIPIDERAPQYLSGAKRTKYGRERILGPEWLSTSVETIVVVD